MSLVTEKLIHQFGLGSLVDVKNTNVRRKTKNVRSRNRWRGPYKIVEYEIDPPKQGVNPAAHMKIEVGRKKEIFECVLIVDDEQTVRPHIPKEHRQRYTIKRVETPAPRLRKPE